MSVFDITIFIKWLRTPARTTAISEPTMIANSHMDSRKNATIFYWHCADGCIGASLAWLQRVDIP